MISARTIISSESSIYSTEGGQEFSLKVHIAAIAQNVQNESQKQSICGKFRIKILSESFLRVISKVLSPRFKKERHFGANILLGKLRVSFR